MDIGIVCAGGEGGSRALLRPRLVPSHCTEAAGVAVAWVPSRISGVIAVSSAGAPETCPAPVLVWNCGASTTVV